MTSGAGTQTDAGSTPGQAQVTITYALHTATLAQTLLTDSAGKGPGKALRSKAAAIQTAVLAGQVSDARVDIPDYLGLVSTQTGKQLKDADAATLTADARNLAAALGC